MKDIYLMLTSKKTLFVVLVFLTLPPSILLAQLKTVTGAVRDEKGAPISGVSVLIKGTSTGTTTNESGQFTISAPAAATLVISNVGFADQEVAVKGQSSIAVRLVASSELLNQMVVVGYGTQKRLNVTGSVATINASDIKTMPDANVASRLQGRVPGVTVTGDNSPGGTPSVIIRGFGSINNSDPLYVIDGVPTTNLNGINPNDIESMTVLKDASSAAIYGSRASNGVILVTTKRGTPGKARLAFSTRVGLQRNQNEMAVLSPQESGELGWLQYKNDGLKMGDIGWGNPTYGYGATPRIPDYILPVGKMVGEVDESLYKWPRPYFGIIKTNKEGTDWYKAIEHPNPLLQEYNLSISGGTEKSDYAISAGYMSQNGTVNYTGFKRYSLRSNANVAVTDWLKIGESLSAAYTDRNGLANNNDLNSVALAARTSTSMPIYDIKGNWAGSWNPLALLYRNKDDYTRNMRIVANTYAQATIAKDFTFRSILGIDYTSARNKDRNLIMYESSDAAASDLLNESYNGGLQYNWDNTLNYSKTFGEKHHLNVLVGSSVVNNRYEVLTAGRSTYAFTDVDFMVLNSGEKDQTSGGNFDQWYTLSYFSRLNYDFKGKYLLEGVVRRDGSSRFSEANRWGTFPALSAGWRVSKEAFMSGATWINDLKLRVGYGQNGNDNVGNYNTYSSYRSNMFESYYNMAGTGSSTSQAGFHLYKFGNPDALWETSTTTDFGIDAVLFQNKLGFNFDVFNRRTTDMLYPDSRPATAAGLAVLPSVNVGEMLNKGFDLALTYHGNPGGNFKYNIQANFSHYNNKVVKLNGNPDEVRYGTTLRNSVYSISKAGVPVSSFYGYQVEGIFNTQKEIDDHAKYNPDNTGKDNYSRPGMFMFKDVNGDKIINSLDRTIIGNPHPDLTYGLNMDFSYKNWDLAMFFQGVHGNQLINFLKWDGFAGISTRDQLYESWTKDRAASGATITYPMQTRNNTELHLPSSFFVEDGAYFRMKSLVIGYTIPSAMLSRVKIGGLRIYAQATNLFTITKYSGLDPEVRQINNLTLGVDAGIYPTPQTVMFGIDLNL